MSTSRRSSTARFSASASCASSRSAVVRSIWSDSPLIWRSSSLTMRLVVSFWRSMLASSTASECAWPRSRSSSRSTSERSRRMPSRRCWFSRSCCSNGAGRWAASGRGTAGSATATTAATAPAPPPPPPPPPPASRLPPASHAPQVSSHRRRAPAQPEQRPEPDDRERLLPREERRLDEPAVDEEVGGVRQADRHEPAQRPLDRALEEEGPADEAVGRPDQPHDGDLAAALQHRHTDGGADDDHRHDGEGGAHHEPHRRRDLAQPVELP